jgi:alginate O-acetyltransferase complex protein AlgI
MLFNSYTFWIFFAVVIFVYRRLPHRAQNRFLLVASYFFYGFWDWRFLTLIFVSTVIDYLVALGIGKQRRKSLLWLSLVANLGLLAFFKYCKFFVNETVELLNKFGLEVSQPILEIALPVGISFYTFQTMSYTIDVWRGQTKPARGFLDFALYVSFFPQLVAGPIERSTRLMPQVLNPRTYEPDDFRIGLYHIAIGLFKKVVIADNMAIIANHVFGQPVNELTAPLVLVGVYAFAFQIYGDFSAYSSIAQGVAKWLGFDLMINFRHPYFASSPQDFWKRWHISLSSWLRDYLYIPLGGNRGGAWRTSRNLLITMLLGGLWHGANWTFLIWGLVHGLWLLIHRLLPKFRVPKLLGIFVTFHIVCLAWLFFRADTTSQAFAFLDALSGSWAITPFVQFSLGMLAFFLIPLLVFELWVERSGDLLSLTERPWKWRAAVYIYITLMLLYFPAPVANEFIYFQF